MVLPALALAVKALKVTKAVSNTLGTKPTPTPDVKVQKSKKWKPKNPKAGTPGTNVPVELDEAGHII